jgi:hypothetical protein
MDSNLSIQYQALAQPPAQSAQPGQSNAAPWLYAWSEPVRQKIKPALAIALAASGYFGPAFVRENPTPANAAPWLYAWSEPVRVKPAVRTGLQQALAFNPQPVVPTDWRQWLSEPVREKKGLKAYLQRDFTIDANFVPKSNTLLEGYNWWSEPVRQRPGLKTYLQQTTTMPLRVLPPVNVTATLRVTEINTDVFVGAVNVYKSATPTTSGQGAKVSIVEVPGSGGDPVSVRES